MLPIQIDTTPTAKDVFVDFMVGKKVISKRYSEQEMHFRGL